MSDKHYHWSFIAYNDIDVLKEASKDEPDQVKNVVSINVIGYVDEVEAESAARLIIERDRFSLRQVYECSRCGFEKDMTKAMENVAKKI